MDNNITWSAKTFDLAELIPQERNPRRMTLAAFERLKAKMKSQGYHTRILTQPDGRVIGGHMRLLAAQELGISTIECLVPSRDLTDDEMDELTITDNLHDGAFDVELLANGFDMDKLLAWGMPEALLTGPTKAPKAKKEKAAAEPKSCPHCGELID